jgi:hypothetical protein
MIDTLDGSLSVHAVHQTGSDGNFAGHKKRKDTTWNNQRCHGGWSSGTTDHCRFYSTLHDGKVAIRRRSAGSIGGGGAKFSKEGDLGQIEAWFEQKGGSLLVTEGYDHSNDATYRGFSKYFDTVMVHESYSGCRDQPVVGTVKHLCAKTPKSAQRPSKWQHYKSGYQKLIGTGPYDMIFVKGYVCVCVCVMWGCLN